MAFGLFGAADSGSCQAGQLAQTPQQHAVTPESRVPDDRGRRQAALAGHAGDENAARAALASDHPPTRATALAALARMEKLSDADLTAALGDGDAVVRRRACELAAAHAAVGLTALLGDVDPMVVEAAAWALGEQGATDAVPALSTVVTDHDEPLCREAAVAALGAIGDDAGLAAILTATTDKPAVRRRAVLALAPFDGPEVQSALERALEDRDWQVRQAAEDLLR
jgi:HEAT repeat protein